MTEHTALRFQRPSPSDPGTTDPQLHAPAGAAAKSEPVQVVLNLGCGVRTSPRCRNVDWSPYLRLKTSPLGRNIARLVLTGHRRERFLALDDDIRVHDLRRGIPWPASSVDAVYSSHVLEHIDRCHAESFAREMYRVLKPGGVVRIVVPDLALLVDAYRQSTDVTREGGRTPAEHEETVGRLFEQMVRRESAATTEQRHAALRVAERAIRGDARRRGETHQWMYDELTLSALLVGVGFSGPRRTDHRTSTIAGWTEIDLDRIAGDAEYKPGSLYIEAFKPAAAATGES